MSKKKFNLIYLEYLTFLVPKGIKYIELNTDNIIYIYLKNNITENYFLFLCKFLLKNNTILLNQFIDLIAVDKLKILYNYNKTYRFFLFYNFLSTIYNFRLILIKNHNEFNFTFSLKNFYNSSNWLEREVWDLFGIFFFNHTDLRRILTDYGFEGFPLRKDFPLTGFLEISYDEEKKILLYKEIEMTQEFRNYKFISPWIV